MLLSEGERKLFSNYCRNYANSTELIIKQLEKLPVPKALVEGERAKVVAFNIVANHLDSGESVSIK
jgi:hypothetical protein